MAGAEGEKAAAGGAPAEASVSPRQMRRAPRRLSGILGGDGGLMNCARRGSSYNGPGGPGGRGTSEAMETRLDQLDAKLEAFKEEVLLLLRDRANAVTRAQDLGEQEEHVRRKAKENLTDVDEVTRMMSDPDFDRVLQQVMKNNALHRTSADLRPRSLDSQRRASSATQRCGRARGRDSATSASLLGEKESRYVLPHDGRFRTYWDFLTLLLVLFSCVFIPLRIAFDLEIEGGDTAEWRRKQRG